MIYERGRKLTAVERAMLKDDIAARLNSGPLDGTGYWHKKLGDILFEDSDREL